MPITLQKHLSKCFVCGAQQAGPYSESVDARHHPCSVGYMKELSGLYLNRFPEPALPRGLSIGQLSPPLLHAVGTDAMPDFWTVDGRPRLVRSAADEKQLRDDASRAAAKAAEASIMLPYEAAVVRCGNATLREFRTSQGNSPLGINDLDVTILDLSTYTGTHTLKDPRSTAIVNVASINGIRHLALWSAGNAAMSLAIAVNHYNAVSKQNDNIVVHVLVHRGTSPLIINTLRAYGALVTEIANLTPITCQTVFKIICKTYHRETGGLVLDPATYWEVTDGWDGVGTLMYRLLVSQVVGATDPNVLIVPCGTGSLMAGAYLGIRDQYADPSDDRQPFLIGALPYGANALQSILQSRAVCEFRDVTADTTQWPVAPKVAVAHTAMSPCISKMLGPVAKGTSGPFINTQERVAFIEINLDQQIDAGRQMRKVGVGPDFQLAWEPSGLLQFAALHQVRRIVKTPGPLKICIVNTGCGLISEREHALFATIARRD